MSGLIPFAGSPAVKTRSTPEEGQQVGVEPVFLRGGKPVGPARVDLQGREFIG
jgi:hypothetical protein